MRTKNFAYHLLALFVIAATVLSACGGGGAASNFDWSTAKSAADGGGMDALIAAAKAEGALNVIALPEDWCNYGEAISTFSTKYGITVNSITPDAGSADELQAIIDNKEVVAVGPVQCNGPVRLELGVGLDTYRAFADIECTHRIQHVRAWHDDGT